MSREFMPQSRVDAIPYLKELQANGWNIIMFNGAIMPEKKGFNPEYADQHTLNVNAQSHVR
jgi:hypothetical protein